MVDVRAFGSGLAHLAWVAARSFAATLLVLTAAGFILAGLSYYLESVRKVRFVIRDYRTNCSEYSLTQGRVPCEQRLSNRYYG